MTAVAGPGVVPPDEGPGRDRAPRRRPPARPADRPLPPLPDELVRGICPYLGTGEGWRLAVPDRVHRCLAVSPAVQLSLDKQARLCLVEGHRGCATFRAAVAARESGDPSAVVARDRTTVRRRRWSVPRTQTTVLDVGRGSLDLGTVARQRATAQVALVLLALVAFSVLILARLSGAGPAGTGTDPGRSVPVAAASTVPSAISRGGSATPQPSSPTPSASRSPKPGQPSAAVTTYRVRAGDTLRGIAARFGTTVHALRVANDISDTRALRIGQVLRIPH